MDYVLFGMGYGASLMLLGWALRTFGPQLKYNKPSKEESAEYRVGQRFWVRFIQGLGGVIAIAGTAMVLMTFIVVLVNPSDSAGRTMAFAIWALILIAVLVWCWFYLSNYGLAGIWTRQGGYGIRGQSSPSLRSSTEPRVVTAKSVTPTERPERADAVHDDPAAAETTAHKVEQTESVAPAEVDEVTEDAGSEPIEPEPEDVQEIEPVYDFGDGTETTVPSESSGRGEALRRLRERQARARESTNL